MKLLALALLLCALASLSNAACYFKGTKAGATHCQDDVDQTWHEVGSSWTNSECMACTCSECCSSYTTPTRFPDDCEAVFDSQACQYVVRKKNDPTVQCPIYGAVGK